MFKRWLVAVAGTFVLSSQADAQSRWDMLTSNVKNSAGDAWDVWTSPLRGRPRDWLTAAGVIAGSAAISPLDDDVDRWAVNHADDNVFNVLDPVRPGGWAYSGRTITPVAIGALALSIATKNQRLQEGILGCATSYGSSSVVRTFVVYPLVARTRPDPDRNDGPAATQGDQYHFDFPGSGQWGEHSLPGGHLANITACVTFLTSRYHMGRIVEPVLWATVAGVGVGRVLDRAHWTSDQTLGLLFGYAVGRQVALRSSRRNEKRADAASGDSRSSFILSPGVQGTRVGWQFAF